MSWVPGADGSGFGIEHLPYGVISRYGAAPRPRCESAIGRWSWRHWPRRDCSMKWQWSTRRCRERWTRQRSTPCSSWDRPPGHFARLTDLLGDGDVGLAGTELADRALVPLDEVETALPIEVADYVDFYSSLEHSSNVGSLIRPDGDPLFPNWRHLPVGYHGRAGSVVPSGTQIKRPQGQSPPAQPGESPGFGPERLLDFELELGFLPAPALPAESRSRPPMPPITSSASRSSTTGAPDRSRPGSTSRSAPSSASRSRPRSRPGLRRWKRSSRSAFRAPPRSRRLRPTCGATSPGRSTSSSRSRWPPLERPTSR